MSKTKWTIIKDIDDARLCKKDQTHLHTHLAVLEQCEGSDDFSPNGSSKKYPTREPKLHQVSMPIGHLSLGLVSPPPLPQVLVLVAPPWPPGPN